MRETPLRMTGRDGLVVADLFYKRARILGREHRNACELETLPSFLATQLAAPGPGTLKLSQNTELAVQRGHVSAQVG
jgi:hypothetical protein